MKYREVTLQWRPRPEALGGRRARRGGAYTAYVPERVADLDPALLSSLLPLVLGAEDAVRSIQERVPGSLNLEVLARQLLRAEAVASSRIEGHLISHRRLAKAAFGAAADANAQAVLGNIAGMERALALAVEPRVFMTADLLAVHRAMFEGTRDDRIAGLVRTEQNWIGGEASSPLDAEFVPPPPEEVSALLDDLCGFVSRDDLPPVIQAAIAHVQFETIHPFHDGNGRVGRALIHVVLRRRGVAGRMLPPVSLVLAARADDYVKGLTSFRYRDEEDWYELFGNALGEAARASTAFADQVVELQERWRETAGRPRRGSAAAKLIERLPSHPIVNLQTAMALTGASDEAVRLALNRLEAAGVLRQTTLGRRNRAFECVGLFALLDELERSVGPRGRAPAPTR
jgi:Fic family protein